MNNKGTENLQPRNQSERGSTSSGIIMASGLLALAGLGTANFFTDKIEDRALKNGLKEPSPIEHIAEIDAETFEDLNLDNGTLVYDDTNDSYIVYLDDSEVNPAQAKGWYEINTENLIIPDTQTQE